MKKAKLIRNLIGISALSGIVYFKINFESQSLIWKILSDFLVVLILLGFGEILLITVATGVAQIILKAVQLKTNKLI